MKGTLEERFFIKVRKGRKPDDCWEWLASTNGDGGYKSPQRVVEIKCHHE